MKLTIGIKRSLYELLAPTFKYVDSFGKKFLPTFIEANYNI